MAGFGQNRTSFDGSIPNRHGNRPRVNLPELHIQRDIIPADGHYVASAEPNTMSLSNYIPNLPATPQVNLPTRQILAHDLSDTTQSVATQNDLEGRLRGMILGNAIPDEPTPLQTISNGSRGPNQRSSRRPNQAQRRQQTAQSNRSVPSYAPINEQPHSRISIAPNSSNDLPRSQASDVQYQLPHLRGSSTQTGQSSNNNHNQGNSRFSRQRQLPDPHWGPNPPLHSSSVRNQTYDRPPPTRRQLYNPGPYGMQSRQTDRPPGQRFPANLDLQVDYLDQLAHEEISKAEISQEELLGKHALRESLERVCREAVSEYEMHKAKDAAFDPDSVELRCFGSLSTTFATKSSDMDLVLVSPMSKPEASTPDSDIPRLIEKALLNLGYGARLLTKTRVPIIRFCEKPTPELVDLLLAERTKYEKERDAPPEIKTQKTPKRKEKRLEKAETPFPQAGPSDMAANEAAVEVKGPNVATYKNNQGLAVSESAEVPESPPSDIAQKKLSPLSQTDREGQLKTTRHNREGDDPSLAEKSDEERARLYKLAIQDGWYEPTERQIIRHFLSAIARCGVQKSEKSLRYKPQEQLFDGRHVDCNDNEHLEKARAALGDLPNVLGRYRPPPAAHPLDFPKEGVGIQCDINFSNFLALQNSHLLKCYAFCDPRVRQMVLFVKAWTKRRKINTPYHGTLSSYGYVLMVLHYLVNIANPPVVPNLQASPLKLQDELSAKEVLLEGYNVHFFRNEEKILELAHRGQLTFNQEPLGSLLKGFFHYFAQQGYGSPSGGFAWTQDSLSLRTIGGIIPKQAKGWTGAKTETVDLSGPGPQTKEIRQRYLFAIEDPFETDHNIARTVVHNGIVAIRDEFRRAHTLIRNAGIRPGGGPEDLFAEADEKDHLRYQPFGPRPRKDGVPGQNGSKKSTGPVSGPVSGHNDERSLTTTDVAKNMKQEISGNAGPGLNHVAEA